MPWHRALAAILLVLVLSSAGCAGRLRHGPAPAAAAAGNSDGVVTVNGEQRTYHLHAPPGAVASDPLPLLVMLHGGLGSGTQMERDYGMDVKADQLGFYVVYPEGTPILDGGNLRTWNAEHCCGPAHRLDVDDIQFIAAVIDQVRRDHGIDATRIGVAGHSNGAMMAYSFAATRSDLVTSVMSVAGAIGGQEDPLTPWHQIDDPAKPVAALILHARDDDHVPFEGGLGKASLEATRSDLSVEQALDFWLAADRVTATPTNTTTVGVVTTTVYEGAAKVMLVTTEGGHGWPGVDMPFGAGPDTPDASAVVARFLMENPRI